MNSPTDRKVVIALLAIFAVCLVGLGGSLYRAKAAELKSLRTELAKKTEERDKVKAQIAQMPELEAKYAQLQERLSILEPALPDSAYIPTFLRQIENLAVGTSNQIVAIRPRPEIKTGRKGSGVQINDETGDVVQGKEESSGAGAGAKEGAEAPKLPYRFIPIELRTEGTYWTAVDFLRELQRFPKMIAVNNVAFAPKNGPGQSAASRQELVTTMDMLAVVATTKGKTNGSAQPK